MAEFDLKKEYRVLKFDPYIAKTPMLLLKPPDFILGLYAKMKAEEEKEAMHHDGERCREDT